VYDKSLTSDKNYEKFIVKPKEKETMLTGLYHDIIKERGIIKFLNMPYASKKIQNELCSVYENDYVIINNVMSIGAHNYSGYNLNSDSDMNARIDIFKMTKHKFNLNDRLYYEILFEEFDNILNSIHYDDDKIRIIRKGNIKRQPKQPLLCYSS